MPPTAPLRRLVPIAAALLSVPPVVGEFGDDTALSLSGRAFLLGAGLLAGWALVGAGLLLGRLLAAAAGLGVLLAGVQALDHPAAYVTGNLAGALTLAALAHLALTTGGRLPRPVVAGIYLVETAAVLAWLTGFAPGPAAVVVAAYTLVLLVLFLAGRDRSVLGLTGALLVLLLGIRQVALFWPGPYRPAASDAVAAALFVVLVAWPAALLAGHVNARIAGLRARQQALAASLVTVGDDTRRTIERDLHDGAQQRLATLLLLLAGERTDAAWHQAREDVLLTLAELREIAHGAYPAVLAEAGLVSALEALAERSPVPLRVAADPHWPARLPEPVERGLYFAVAEALANSAKHARAGQVSVTLTATDRTLSVEVADDGAGGATLGPASALADRADALGARLSVTSPRGAGTAVLVELPREVGQDGQHAAVVVGGLR
ncbi:sensor histidine kinase [Yinghuangia sp. YIM S09857]|uniref:sensor histidine kinase n=1 Tax=Yinghuangia sp. YIM S09857 TaxID=3436929 RepID=UPI003F53DA06